MKKFAVVFGLTLLTACGGAVTRRTEIQVPSAYGQAKTATLSELVRLINERYAVIDTLSAARVKLEFAGRSVEKGYLESYPRANAYSVAKQPDSIFLNILNPLTSSTVATMAASGGSFQIWVPRENKYLIGKTDVETAEEENPLYNVRPDHLLEGILVEPIPVGAGQRRHFLEEFQDDRFKYYLIGIIAPFNAGHTAELERKLWIERSEMRLVRQQYYDSGKVISDIEYDELVDIEGFLINSVIEIERELENYHIRFEIDPEGIRVNQPIREGAFEVPRPPGAELVVIEGRTNN